MYLVDTNVISAGAPTKAVALVELTKWMDEHSTQLYLSVVTVAKIEDGIAKARRERARRKAADLMAWLDTVLHLYGDRVLAFDVAVGGRCRSLGTHASRIRYMECRAQRGCQQNPNTPR